MAATPSTDPLIWIDCEMTGLDPDSDSIMSICCFITDSQLQIVDSAGWEAFIHHPKSRLDMMGEWCARVHGASGLTAKCIASTTTHEQAAEGLLDYLKQHVPRQRVGLLAGNSIHQDKAFLRKKPYDQVLKHLHYRLLDVSSLKEAVRRWGNAEVLNGIPRKKTLHSAREDILESIEEAKYYKERLFEGHQ